MSILDTFYILFKSNSDAVVAEQAKATAAGEATAISLSKAGEAGETMGKEIAESSRVGAFEIKELDRVIRRFGIDFVRQTAELGTQLLGLLAVEGLVDKTLETADVSDKLGLTAKALGLNVSELDAWDQAVIRSGGSAEGFQASIKSLNEKLAGLEVGDRGRSTQKFFKELGINALDASGKMRPVLALLPELADKFSKLPNAQATAIGMRLGLDQGTITLLEQGRAAVDALVAKQRALGVETQKDADIADDFENELADFKQSLNEVFITIDDYVLPALTEMMRDFEDITSFLEEHGTLVKAFFGALAAVITYEYLPAITAAAVETVIATAPIWLIGAAVIAMAGAFAIAYDDITNFLEGNNSLIGVWLDKWLGPNGAKGIRKLLDDLGNDFIKFGKTVSDEIQKLIDLWDKFLKLAGLAGATPQPASGPIPANIRSPVTPMQPMSVAAWRAQYGSIPYGDMQAAKDYLAHANSPLLSQSAGSMAAHQGNVTNNITVGTTTVNTQATDAKDVAKAVVDTQTKHIRAAINHYTDGVQG